jgi:hypothetical protein
MNLIYLRGETLVGFIDESGGDNSLHASPSGGVREKTRVNAVPGNDPERI